MLREKLFSTLDESDGNFQNLPQSGLDRIAESFTKWSRPNHENAEFITKWTRANC